jgi:hypothetical protein
MNREIRNGILQWMQETRRPKYFGRTRKPRLQCGQDIQTKFGTGKA